MTKSHQFPIIALGASAGGLEAFESFFTRIPATTGMAYVVLTHLDRDHVSILSDLLKKYTPMPIFTIIDGVKVEPNTIYVIPPRKNVALEDGLLNLVEQDEPHFSNLPINFFFLSLAREAENRAVAIILSGAGTDGTIGAHEVKINGGLVIAQEPLSAKFDSMPSSAIQSGFVDYVLPPELMPEQIARWAEEADNKEDGISSDIEHILSLVRSRTSYDFSSYKLTTIRRRIEKQMIIHNCATYADYVLLLSKESVAIDNLFKDFLIGVTRFFRDSDCFEFFKNTVLAKVLANKPKDYNLRVWVPGCATGEEVYSLAIMIAEYMEESKHHFYVQIFGTDIDRNALMHARTGVYSDAIEKDVTPSHLQRFFTKGKSGYKVKKEIRSMVIFGEQNIIKDPPFTKVDIISCRNLLIYLSLKLQKHLIPLFHYSLRTNGILVLGSSETVGSDHELFAPLDKVIKIFERKTIHNPRRSVLIYPEATRFDHFAFNSLKEKISTNEDSETIHAINHLLLQSYITPCLVVNELGDILYLRGAIERYIRASPFPDKFNIADVVHRDIRNLLKSSLKTAISKKEEVIYHGLTIKDDAELHTVNLRIIPIQGIALLKGMLLIIFEITNLFNEMIGAVVTPPKKAKIVEKLERELINTRENLQATIEEQESSNEELQSLNEELQSTNEEIETSKEELQSLNEELIVTNTELQNRIDQLASVHDDMANLFNSTEIATIFLDNKLCIKSCTPKAQEFIHIIPSDQGRSISHFATTIKYEKLVEDAEEVLKTLHLKEVEVQGKADQWFMIRILPYRTVANLIDGVVITLTDITEHKQSELKLNQLNLALKSALASSKNIVDTINVPLMLLASNFTVISANRSFYKVFQCLPEDVVSKFVYDIPGWNAPELHELPNKKFQSDILFEGFEINVNFSNGEHKKIILNARKVIKSGNDDDMILLTMDIT